jgi:SAM-dependent methyltransferase
VNLGYWGPNTDDEGREGGGGVDTHIGYLQASLRLTSLIASLTPRQRRDKGGGVGGQADGKEEAERVLCVGCGSGRELAFVHENFRVKTLVGVDIRPGTSSHKFSFSILVSH